MPMAIDRWTEVRGERGGDRVVLHSSDAAEPAVIPIDIDDPRSVEPDWARYVAGVVAELRPVDGIRGQGLDHDPDRRWALLQRRTRGRGRSGSRCRRHGARHRAAVPGGRAASVRRSVRDHGPARIDGRCRGRRARDRLSRAHRVAGLDPGRPRCDRGRHWRAPRARIVRLRRSSASVRSRRADHRSAARGHHRAGARDRRPDGAGARPPRDLRERASRAGSPRRSGPARSPTPGS